MKTQPLILNSTWFVASQTRKCGALGVAPEKNLVTEVKYHAVVVSVSVAVPGNRMIPLVPFSHLIHRSVGRAVVRRAVVSNPIMLNIILNFVLTPFLTLLRLTVHFKQYIIMFRLVADQNSQMSALSIMHKNTFF